MRYSKFDKFIAIFLTVTLFFSFSVNFKEVKANPLVGLAGLSSEGLEALLTLLGIAGVEFAPASHITYEFDSDEGKFVEVNIDEAFKAKVELQEQQIQQLASTLSGDQIAYLNGVKVDANGRVSFYDDGIKIMSSWFVDLFSSNMISSNYTFPASPSTFKGFVTNSNGEISSGFACCAPSGSTTFFFPNCYYDTNPSKMIAYIYVVVPKTVTDAYLTYSDYSRLYYRWDTARSVKIGSKLFANFSTTNYDYCYYCYSLSYDVSNGASLYYPQVGNAVVISEPINLNSASLVLNTYILSYLSNTKSLAIGNDYFSLENGSLSDTIVNGFDDIVDVVPGISAADPSSYSRYIDYWFQNILDTLGTDENVAAGVSVPAYEVEVVGEGADSIYNVYVPEGVGVLSPAVDIPKETDIPKDTVIDTVGDIPVDIDNVGEVGEASDIFGVLQNIWNWICNFFNNIYKAICYALSWFAGVLVGTGELDFSGFQVGSEIVSVFPFCIPFDIYDLFVNLLADSKAPAFSIDLSDTILGDINGGSYIITIDITQYGLNGAVKCFRFFVLLSFVLSLALVTRNLIRG